MSKKSRRVAKARRALLALSLVLVTMLVAVGGTIAWLTDETESVVNTFSATNIDITLTETWNTDSNNDGTNDKWNAPLVPGAVHSKDPKVTVVAENTDVDIFLFVKVEESGNSFTLNVNGTETPYKYFNYSVAAGWTQLPGVNGVYYREVSKSETDQTFDVLTNNQVTVESALTKEKMPATNPSLTFTAYAIQKSAENGVNFTAASAWEAIQ